MNAGSEPGRGVLTDAAALPDAAIDGLRADLASSRAVYEELESAVLGIRYILDTCYSYADLRRMMANVQGAPVSLDPEDILRRPDFVCVRIKETGDAVQMLWGEFIAAEEQGDVEYLHTIPPEWLAPAEASAEIDVSALPEPSPAPGFVLIDNRFISVEQLARPADQERYLTPISGRYAGRVQFPKPWWTRMFHFVPIYIDPDVCRMRRVVIENCIHDMEGRPVGMIFSEGGEGGTSYCVGYYGAAWAIDGDRSPLNPGVGAVYVLPGEEVVLG